MGDSSSNDSTGTGSRAAPYKTLAVALNAAELAGKRVYACADGGAFTEALTIDTTLDGSELFGGFNCATWVYQSGLHTPVIAPTPVALTVTNLSAGLLIEDFDITAGNETPAGGSSIAVRVVGSQGVVFRRSSLTAGDGANGTAGSNGTPGSDGATPTAAQNGTYAASCTLTTRAGGTANTTSSCGSRGGDGGTGVVLLSPDCTAGTGLTTIAGSGGSGIPTTNLTSTTGGTSGAGQHFSYACPNGLGNNGGDSLPGGDGAAGLAGNLGTQASGIGVFTETGYTPANGAAGINGHTGQGGGGGGAAYGTTTCAGASGGAGGMGGCGGTHGTGGTGGGASVGLVSWLSGVTLDACTVTAGNGGAGGNSGNGGAGGNGAAGGTAASAASAGGKGGDGGDGGSGSGGTGGPSIAVVYHGTVPAQTASQLTVGSGGNPGAGGTVANRPAPSGSKGQTAQLYQQT